MPMPAGAPRLVALLAGMLWNPASAATQALLWFQAGHPTPQAEAVLAQLDSAADRGLDPVDYDAAALVAAVERQRHDGRTVQPDLAALDAALSVAVFDYAHDLHSGRIDARAAGFAIGRPRPPLDRAQILARLAHSRDPAAEFAALEPQFVHYRLLEAALRHYRDLARQGELTRLPPLPKRTLRPGDRHAGASALRRLLVAMDDPAAGAADVGGGVASVDADVMDGALVKGLVRFQAQHGLVADGLLSGRTYRALTTPMSARVHSIELTLERWRWLPPFTAPPIIVNIPQFQLFAFRTTSDRAADIAQMPVIVGQSFRDKRTPVFVSELRYLVFRPYWDVPASIVRAEMLAPMRADPLFLERNGLEIVRG
ncbi:MAG: L,D-transpeptidase family protein, partial [Gammaproteobacteria bacterium]|nr:L,D-transpeptidase family protein [Gammaproteobacteria bacterium]